MALPIFLLLTLIAPSSTFSTPIQQDPTLVVEHVHRKINESRRNMGFLSCGTG
nr:probable pectate lyase 5 [Tanacetum cinerariifolium]